MELVFEVAIGREVARFICIVLLGVDSSWRGCFAVTNERTGFHLQPLPMIPKAEIPQQNSKYFCRLRIELLLLQCGFHCRSQNNFVRLDF